MANKRSLVQDLRGAGRLAVDATVGVTDLVEVMHQNIAAGPNVLGRPLAGIARVLTAPAYAAVRGVTGAVGAGLDRALAELEPLIGPSVPALESGVLLAVLNGVLGDYLEATDNPLAIRMQLRREGRALKIDRDALAAALPDASGKLLILAHGSCMNDEQWSRRGHDHGAALARDLGFCPVHLYYNSGLHVSSNGRALAELLQQLVDAWPVPLEQVVVVGHSMGGLVLRSACHVAEIGALGWRSQLRALVTIGTPHHGSPLERHGNRVDVLLGISRYSAPLARLGKIRSAGVTDLRYGNVLDEHWDGVDRFAHASDRRRMLHLPEGVACYAVAGSSARAPSAHPPGDGLVPVASAFGRHDDPARALLFLDDHRWLCYGHNHLDLLDSAEVYGKLHTWLADSEA